MAEAIFNYLVLQAGLAGCIEADSAGVADWDIDSAPHPGTMYLLEQNGIHYHGQGRNFTKSDFDKFNYIITMDDENLRAVNKLGKGRAQVAPLLSFVKSSPLKEIPDPYFDNGFEVVYDMIQTGAAALLNEIRQRHAL